MIGYGRIIWEYSSDWNCLRGEFGWVLFLRKWGNDVPFWLLYAPIILDVNLPTDVRLIQSDVESSDAGRLDLFMVSLPICFPQQLRGAECWESADVIDRSFTYFANLHASVIIILKSSLKWIPFVGWVRSQFQYPRTSRLPSQIALDARGSNVFKVQLKLDIQACQFYSFIFVSRSWTSDKAPFLQGLKSVAKGENASPNGKLALLIFPEGTLVTGNVSRDTVPAWLISYWLDELGGWTDSTSFKEICGQPEQ